MMIPEWMTTKDNYIPLKDHGSFVLKTINSIGTALSRIRVQKGHEKKHHLPAMAKLFLLLGAIITLSVTTNKMIILIFLAIILGYLCTWPAKDILDILKSSIGAAFLAFILFLPAMIISSEGINNNIAVIIKVFMCVMMVSIFNHTTQWNHITTTLRRLHIPGVFVFILDISLKYLVLLGNVVCDMLTSLRLKSVGKNNRKYNSVGGIMGVTFVKGAEMNEQMYEAMRCRGFTDDYKGL